MGFSPKSDLKMAVAHVKFLCQTPKKQSYCVNFDEITRKDFVNQSSESKNG